MSDIDTAKLITTTVAAAMTAVAPATGPAAPFVTLAAASIGSIMELAESLNQRDAVLAALDAQFALVRAANDADLDAKWAKP